MADSVIPLQTKDLLAHYRRAIAEDRSPFPHAADLGFRLIEVEPGRAVVELDCEERHRNTFGTIHGGVFCSVADTAMGIAHGSLVAEGELSTTVDLQINFLRPMTSGRMRAEARVVKNGRTLTMVECDVYGPDGKLAAKASSNCMTLR